MFKLVNTSYLYGSRATADVLFITKNVSKKLFGTLHSVSVSVSGRYRKFGIGIKKVPPVVPKYRNAFGTDSFDW